MIALAAAVAAGLLIGSDEPVADENAGGRVAPAFSLPDVNRPDALVSLPQGKPVVLYFFASWCVPCRKELPIVVRAAQERTGVAFVGVNHLDQLDDAREFMAKYDATSLAAGHDPAGNVALKYRVRGLPATVFIDRGGHIVSTLHGELDRPTLDERIDDLL